MGRRGGGGPRDQKPAARRASGPPPERRGAGSDRTTSPRAATSQAGAAAPTRDVLFVGDNWAGTADVLDPQAFERLARIDTDHMAISADGSRIFHASIGHDAAASPARVHRPADRRCDLDRQFDATWRKRAAQLRKAAASKPLDTARVDDLTAETGRDVSTAELYTLPQ